MFWKRVTWFRHAMVLLGLFTVAMAACADGKPASRKKTFTPVKAVADRALNVATPQGSGVLPLYVSRNWSKPQPGVTRALLIFHGAARNAADYNRSGETAIATAGLGKEMILIAPQFLEAQDVKAFNLSGDTLRWKHSAWEGGADAIAPAPVSSFDAIDSILARLANRQTFPNLKIVVLAGHSGGGQILQRYAVVGRGEQALTSEGVHVRYVVANPSSYVYFNAERPTAQGGFAPYDDASCPKFNRWKYGLIDTPRYAGQSSAKSLEAKYIARDVIYLLGERDIDPQHHAIDQSCSGEAEGPYRLARGIYYFHYLERRHPQGFTQKMWGVPGVGHDDDKMFNSSCGLAALFDDGVCATPLK